MPLSKDQRWEIRRRLENWVRWYRYGGAPVGPAGSSSQFPAYRLVNIRSTASDTQGGMTVLAGEGEDTDRILRKMNPRMSKVLIVNYLAKGNYLMHAKRFRVGVRMWYRMVERAELVFHRLCWPRRAP